MRGKTWLSAGKSGAQLELTQLVSNRACETAFFQIENKRTCLKVTQFKIMKIAVSGELAFTKADPALSVLNLGLVDFPDLLLSNQNSPHWLLSKEVIFQPIKVNIGPILTQQLESTARKVTSLESFIIYLDQLTAWLDDHEAHPSWKTNFTPLLNLDVMKLLSGTFDQFCQPFCLTNIYFSYWIGSVG